MLEFEQHQVDCKKCAGKFNVYQLCVEVTKGKYLGGKLKIIDIQSKHVS